MFQLDHSNFAPRPAGNLIKSDEYQSLLSSEQLVQAAEEKAKQILADAQKEWQRQREEGYQAGLKLANQAAAQVSIAHHQRILNHLTEVRGQLTEIVLQAVAKIVGELSDAETVGRLLDKSLADLVGQNRITILVHPDHLATIDQRVDALCRQHGIEAIELHGDPRVPVDTCVLSTPKQVIDASLNVQLTELRQLLTQVASDSESVQPS